MIGKSILTTLAHELWSFPTKHPTQWPGLCQLCRRPTGAALCNLCIGQFSATRARCQTCALPTPQSAQHCGACLRSPPPLTHCAAAVDYQYPWSDLIQDFKFRQHLGWTRLFSSLMFGHPTARNILDNTDLVVPIPSSPERIRERGYDHLRELLRHPPSTLPPTVWLQRVHQTTPQHQSSRSQRLTLDRHALIIPSSQLSVLRGRRLTLIDDVMTTGATLHAAAEALLHAGACEVTAVVLARTIDPKHLATAPPHVQHRSGSS